MSNVRTVNLGNTSQLQAAPAYPEPEESPESEIGGEVMLDALVPGLGMATELLPEGNPSASQNPSVDPITGAVPHVVHREAPKAPLRPTVAAEENPKTGKHQGPTFGM